jgi:hypothetical protein
MNLKRFLKKKILGLAPPLVQSIADFNLKVKKNQSEARLMKG